MKLIHYAQTKNVRCLNHVLCPKWFKDLVRDTFKHVRDPGLLFLRCNRDQTTAVEDLRAQMRKEQEAASAGPSLAVDQEGRQRAMMSEKKAEEDAEVAEKEMKDKQGALELQAFQFEEEAQMSLQQAKIFLGHVTNNSHFLLKDKFNGRPGAACHHDADDSDGVETESDDSDDVLPLHRVQSEWLSPLKSSFKSSTPKRFEALSIYLPGDCGGTDDETPSPRSHRTRRTSADDLTPRATPKSRNAAPSLSSWTGHVSSFDCTTDFEYATAGTTAHHTQSLGETSWIAKLITVEISLDASLGASILHLQTALKLRGEVLQEVNRMLQAGLATEVIDDILGILRDTRVIADLHVRLLCMFRDSLS
jgi:hypothetical protein